MMKKILFTLLFSVLSYGQSLEVLLQKAKAQNLSLQESHDAIMIREAQVDVADTWDNPILGIGANDLLLDDITSRDLEPMQTHFVTLSQKIPTHGKNKLKKSIATVAQKLSAVTYHDSVLKLESRLTLYVYKVVMIEKKIALIDRYKNNVRKLKQLHTKRVEIGKSSQRAIEKSKILEKKLSIKKRKLTRMKSALLYKIEKMVYEEVASVEVPLKMDKAVVVNFDKHPIMIKERLKVAKAKENLKLQRAKRTPDVKVGMGYFQRMDRSDYLSLNVGMALPVRGKEQSAIKVALLAQSQAEKSLKTQAFSFKKDVQILKELMEDSLANYRIIKKEILPKQRYIQKLLEQEIFTKNSSSTRLLENLNATIMLELEAYNEVDSYFEAYAKLLYFSGDLS